MLPFLLIAALMTGTAVIVIALPLVRGGRRMSSAVLVASLVPVSATALYVHWSNWNWQHTPPAAAQAKAKPDSQPDVAVIVTKLEQRLSAQPNNVDGWLMLGKSYRVLGQTDRAVSAYAQAYRWSDGQDASAALSLGEALSLRDGGHVTSEADRLFEEALVLTPQNPQALLLAGLAAAQRGDYTLARRRWEELKAQHPSPRLVTMLDARLAALDAQPRIDK